MSLQNIIDEFDKDNSVTTEQLASSLMNKENLTLKTEIPFGKEVWHTALRKDMCDLVGNLLNNVQIINEDGTKLVPVTYDRINPDGTHTQIPFGQKVAEDLKRNIGYAEEYAVSHKRKGRLELASVLGRKMEMRQAREDTISRVMGK
jgi:hypothetical protein